MELIDIEYANNRYYLYIIKHVEPTMGPVFSIATKGTKVIIVGIVTYHGVLKLYKECNKLKLSNLLKLWRKPSADEQKGLKALKDYLRENYPDIWVVTRRLCGEDMKRFFKLQFKGIDQKNIMNIYNSFMKKAKEVKKSENSK